MDGSMQRRGFLGIAAALALTALPASAEPIPLDSISAYFNALTTLQARFVQTNSDGTQSLGTLYIRRPGNARFEYDPPQEALVLAGGGELAIFDNQSNTGRPEQYPLRRTPLNVILERNVDLANRDAILEHRGTPESTVVIAHDPQNPELGQIGLIFADAPLRLTEWRTQDASGATTRVVLSELRTGHQISARLFSIPQEIEARSR